MRQRLAERQQVQAPAIVQPLRPRLQRLDNTLALDQFHRHISLLRRTRVLVKGSDAATFWRGTVESTGTAKVTAKASGSLAIYPGVSGN